MAHETTVTEQAAAAVIPAQFPVATEALSAAADVMIITKNRPAMMTAADVSLQNHPDHSQEDNKRRAAKTVRLLSCSAIL